MKPAAGQTAVSRFIKPLKNAGMTAKKPLDAVTRG